MADETPKFEPEISSIMREVQEAAGAVYSYYWNLPENFRYPALFFPQPEIATNGDTFKTYASDYSWYIKVFADTTEKAHAIARGILTHIKRSRNCVRLYEEDGRPTGKKLRLNDPALKAVGEGVVQLVIEWRSRRPYYLPNTEKMQHFKLDYDDKGEKEDLDNGE